MAPTCHFTKARHLGALKIMLLLVTLPLTLKSHFYPLGFILHLKSGTHIYFPSKMLEIKSLLAITSLCASASSLGVVMKIKQAYVGKVLKIMPGPQ